MTTGPRTRLLRADDPGWDAAISMAAHDVYQTAGWHAVAGWNGEGDPWLAVVEDDDRGMAWPYLLRTIGTGAGPERDITSVYGYPGPVAWGPLDEAFRAAAWARIVDAWRGQGAVSAFTRFHPVLENVRLLDGVAGAASSADGRPALLDGGSTVSIDATVDDETAARGYVGHIRAAVKVARRDGMVTQHDDDWAALPTFIRLYHETMDRYGADASYYYDQAYVERLRDALEGHLHLFVTSLDGVAAAAGLMTESGGIVQTHLVGTEATMLKRSPYKVLVNDVRHWAHDRGDRLFHLGGGRGGRADTLFDFKAAFSDRRHTFMTGRWILDAEAYDSLVREHGRAAGPRGIDDAFFPAYRAPIRTDDDGGRGG
jgi:hypothetical protein